MQKRHCRDAQGDSFAARFFAATRQALGGTTRFIAVSNALPVSCASSSRAVFTNLSLCFSCVSRLFILASPLHFRPNQYPGGVSAVQTRVATIPIDFTGGS